MVFAISRLSRGKPEGFEVASFLLMITSRVVEFCFASTTNKQFGVGKSERNSHFHPLA